MKIGIGVRNICLVSGLGVVLLISGVAAADEDRWGQVSYPYTVIDQDVQDALTELGRNLEVGVDISDEVEGRLVGPWSSSTVDDFLARTADELDIEWFFEGRRLFVSSRSESIRQLLPLNGVQPEAWKASLDKLGISNDRFPVTIDPAQDMALVSGPPKFVALVAQSLPAAKAASAPVGRVNVIYGRNSRGDSS